MRLHHEQLEKISGYLIDISKLLVGATFVPLFVPGTFANNFHIAFFCAGLGIGMVLLIVGLMVLPSRS